MQIYKNHESKCGGYFESELFRRYGSHLSSGLDVDRGVAGLEERELVVEADLWRRQEAHLNINIHLTSELEYLFLKYLVKKYF